MGNADNSLIQAITLLDGAMRMCHINDRQPIELRHLKQINTRVTMALEKLKPINNNLFVVNPLAEVVTLINTMIEDSTFVETNNESKQIIFNKILESQNELFKAAGRYYETHEFDYSLTLDGILYKMVEANVNAGYYFGMEGQ